jgi:hypothetical protein
MQRNESLPVNESAAHVQGQLNELSDQDLDCVVGGLARAYEGPDLERLTARTDVSR